MRDTDDPVKIKRTFNLVNHPSSNFLRTEDITRNQIVLYSRNDFSKDKLFRSKTISDKFKLASNSFPPRGDQPSAISRLSRGVLERGGCQTLLGVTGSGKTFTIANVIANANKNTLIISHNKTLAAQLYTELKEFFPRNNVGYFVSFYDYYQPESYIPQTDTYIEKDTEINERIEKMRLEATAMLMSGAPTIIIATVSCIYSLGSPIEWDESSILLDKSTQIDRKQIISKLAEARYERNDLSLSPGRFRVRGDVIDIIPAYSQDVLRISLFGHHIEMISLHDPITMEQNREIQRIKIFPAKHYVISDNRRLSAITTIRQELEEWLPRLPSELERQRLTSRTNYDIEMIQELGYCQGIENYSRHFDGRKPGEPPYCLLDFFGEDFILVIDESHVTIPQLHAMFNGDYARKKTLIDYGFRLPSAADNRPLKFREFEEYMKNVIFISATPAEFELEKSWQVVEQLVRPTGLVDPAIEIREAQNQMGDLIEEIKLQVNRNQRTLVTTLTKRMSEDLADYLTKKNVRVRYIHSEIKGLDRTELLRQLRIGEFDVLVGVNLLREGLDLPEVSLVAILDADKEGFLRNATSLVQTFGRAARNVDGRVILYADSVTDSMRRAVAESDRRREKQVQYNLKHKIVPKSIVKPISKGENDSIDVNIKSMSRSDLTKLALDTEAQMIRYAEDLDFERAIDLRSKLYKIKKALGEPVNS
jgi:excinuclease ABC subunit B